MLQENLSGVGVVIEDLEALSQQRGSPELTLRPDETVEGFLTRLGVALEALEGEPEAVSFSELGSRVDRIRNALTQPTLSSLKELPVAEAIEEMRRQVQEGGKK